MSNASLAGGAVESNSVLAVQVLTPASTISVDPTVGGIATLTSAATNMTLNAASVPAGSELVVVITTSGTTGCTVTFGTNFKTTGTVTTGTVSGKVWTVHFVCDGVNFNEVSRSTAAM